MKKKITICILTLFAFVLMSLSVIANDDTFNRSMEKVNNYYNNGYYCEAWDELSWIDYNSCSEEQKSIVDYNKELVSYAIYNVNYIYEKFNLIQNYCDSGLYYEAMNELTWLAQYYALTPLERTTWNAKYADAQAGIQKWESRDIGFDAARQNAINFMWNDWHTQSIREYSPDFSALYISEDSDYYYFNGLWYNPEGLSPGYRLIHGGYYAVNKHSGEVFIILE